MLIEGFGLQLGEAIARGEAERWARSVEARRTAVFDAAPDPVVSVDAEGRVTAFNRAAEEVFGHSSAAAIGRDFIELLIPVRLQEQQRARFLHRLASDRVSVLGRRFESIAVRADGNELPVELTIARAELPGKLGLTIYLRESAPAGGRSGRCATWPRSSSRAMTRS